VADALSRALGVQVSFDATNLRAVNIMAKNRLALVREFTAQQRATTRAALTEGIRAGLNPRAQARAFRGSIGLTETQQRWVSSYRRLLEQNSSQALTRELRDGRFDRTVQAAIRNDRPLTAAQIEKMVERYRERALKYRSEVIARTEALRSVHEGTEEAIRQGVESGQIDATKTRRVWQTAKDERVRSFETGGQTSHRSMHNQEQALGVPFESGAGNLLRYPGDPDAPAYETIQCRCVVATRVSL
jgi:hypothetical protein